MFQSIKYDKWDKQWHLLSNLKFSMFQYTWQFAEDRESSNCLQGASNLEWKILGYTR
jgi:hypothetical protein